MTDSPRRLRVFLCHAWCDKPSVRKLYVRLRRAGFSPWLDEEDLLPGEEWDQAIPRAVRTSDVVLVCLSRAFSTAGYKQKEIKLALDAADQQPEGSVFVIPAKLEECEVPERLGRWQWVELYSSVGYRKLIQSLRLRARAVSVLTGDDQQDHPLRADERPDQQRASPEEIEMAVLLLRGALLEIKRKTHGLYPAIVSCVRSGVDHSEAQIREGTLESIQADLSLLSKGRLLKFDFAPPEPDDIARRIRFRLQNVALLRSIVDEIEATHH